MTDIICLAIQFTCAMYCFMNTFQLMMLKHELDREDRLPVTFAIFICLILSALVTGIFFSALIDVFK